MQKIPIAAFAVDLIAMRSVCLEGQGRVSQLLLDGGRSVHDPRRVRSLVDALARHYAVDLTALRNRCSVLLHSRNYLPLPLNPGLVLIPLPLGQCGENLGYVNLLSVQAVAQAGKTSILDLGQGEGMECRISVASLRNRLVKAQLALRELEAVCLLPRSESDRTWQRKLELIRVVLAGK